MQYEMPAMTEEDRQTLIGLCRIEFSRWKNASEAVPDKRYMVELMNIALAALTEKPAAAPAGWKLVPVEPNWEMISAAIKSHEGDAFLPVSLYKSMLAAAPEAPCLSASSS